MDKKINIPRGIFYGALVSIFGMILTAWLNLHTHVLALEKEIEITKVVRARNEEIIRNNTLRYEAIMEDLTEIKSALNLKQDRKFVE